MALNLSLAWPLVLSSPVARPPPPPPLCFVIRRFPPRQPVHLGLFRRQVLRSLKSVARGRPRREGREPGPVPRDPGAGLWTLHLPPPPASSASRFQACTHPPTAGALTLCLPNARQPPALMRDSWGALGLGVGAQGADHEPTEALWFQERSFPDAHLCCLEVH